MTNTPLRIALMSPLAAFSATAAACGGGDTAPHVAKVEPSGCTCQVGNCPEPIESCVSWTWSDDGALTLSLRGFEEMCGFPAGEPEHLWRAHVQESEGTGLALEVYWDFETPNACGNCVQGWDVSLDPAPTTPVVDLSITTRGCTGDVCAESAPWLTRMDLASGESGGDCPSL